MNAIRYAIATGTSLALAGLGTSFCSAAEAQLEEITVTASKRGFAESLQEMEMSIVAVSSQAIESAGITDLSSLAQLVPSISIVDAMAVGSPQISMRGITAGTFKVDSIQDQALTSVYLDDMPLSAASFVPNMDLFDMQRVEVLRGPQGTLYGNGAMGGNVRFITNKASTEAFAAKMQVDASTVESGEAGYYGKAFVNVPLSDQLALRVVGMHQQDGGYIDNVTLGRKDDNELVRSTVRASLRYLPTDAVEITGNIFYQDSELGDSFNTVVSPDNRTSTMPEGGTNTFQDIPLSHQTEFAVYNLSIEADLGWGYLTSASSMLDTRYSVGGNLGTLVNLFFPGYGFVAPLTHDYDKQDFAQELRLASKQSGSRFNWVVGLYYSDQEMQYDIPDSIAAGFTETLENALGLPIESIIGATTESFGVGGNGPRDSMFWGATNNQQEHLGAFGELTYELTSKLSGTVGLRWSDWSQEYSQHYAGYFNGGESLNTGADEAEKTTYRLTLSYRFNDDVMVYATQSTGFRYGGINDIIPDTCGPTNAPRSFEPDEISNIELGLKSSWLDRALTANITVYRADWENVQSQVALSHCGFAYKNNEGEQKSTGVEVEIAATPIEGLTLGFSGAYIDAEFVKGNPASGAQPGDPAPFVPELAFSTSAEYSFPLAASFNGFGRIDYSYTDERTANYNLARMIVLEPYELINLRAGIRADDRWSVTLYVNNVADERVALTGGVSLGQMSGVYTRPRTVGMSFSKSFE